ncbi:Histidine kinase-like ATPase domain-containing protein [Streptomyces zhaozhouensis]|uniref:Histidine kinase-like ATPase domain-containing protein n=1 Tax=Streptomyces zhaozhouensis TaxID=1300267 RepID=A0A286DYE2_9ACTN|nr:Histidine kinase-like ATPase domain-containing protein [Streptomyces zhaozhouensis]
MAVLHGPTGVGIARRRLRSELQENGAEETIIDDAMLILSELLSNSYRHARPLDDGQSIRAGWCQEPDGSVTISVTDGGGPTRPRLSSPSVTARGGRGLTIITSLCRSWGVRESGAGSAVTVWAVLAAPGS